MAYACNYSSTALGLEDGPIPGGYACQPIDAEGFISKAGTGKEYCCRPEDWSTATHLLARGPYAFSKLQEDRARHVLLELMTVSGDPAINRGFETVIDEIAYDLGVQVDENLLARIVRAIGTMQALIPNDRWQFLPNMGPKHPCAMVLDGDDTFWGWAPSPIPKTSDAVAAARSVAGVTLPTGATTVDPSTDPKLLDWYTRAGQALAATPSGGDLATSLPSGRATLAPVGGRVAPGPWLASLLDVLAPLRFAGGMKFQLRAPRKIKPGSYLRRPGGAPSAPSGSSSIGTVWPIVGALAAGGAVWWLMRRH